MKNETLRKKLEAKQKFLADKIEPLQEELEMVLAQIALLDAYEGKAEVAAQNHAAAESAIAGLEERALPPVRHPLPRAVDKAATRCRPRVR